MKLVYQQILSFSMLLGITKIFSLTKESLLAKNFGVSDEFDQFILALTGLYTFINTFSEPIRLRLVPRLSKISLEHREIIQSEVRCALHSGLQYILSFWVLLLSAFYFYHQVSGLIVPSSIYIAFKLTPIAAVYIFKNILESTLHVCGRYKTTLMTNAINPIAMSILLWWFSPNSLGSLIGLFLISYSTECFVLILIGYKEKILNFIKLSNQVYSIITREYFILVGASLFYTANAFIDQVMASTPSALNYALKIPSMVMGGLSSIITVILFPKLSRIFNDNRENFTKSFYLSFFGLLALGGIFTLALYSFQNEIVGFLYERGKFNVNDSANVTSILTFYLFQIPFYLCGTLIFKIMNVINLERWILRVGLGAFLLNIIFNYTFINVLGDRGIALSTSIVQFFVCGFLVTIFWLWSKNIIKTDSFDIDPKA